MDSPPILDKLEFTVYKETQIQSARLILHHISSTNSPKILQKVKKTKTVVSSYS